ncbi:putative signal peptide protein [Puccinia sorghi]|uniref:Putative signal peptide protein n=1 Tax=Puccinia sorghi TaxID=27349 RepID=A0A0L6UNE5_9BASI|nr:putative signal peptide protein [Puccinia sorghi]
MFWCSHCSVCTVTVHQTWLNYFWRMVGVLTEASWDFLHVNCRQLSKFFCSVSS